MWHHMKEVLEVEVYITLGIMYLSEFDGTYATNPSYTR